jgi:hypothetical protein
MTVLTRSLDGWTDAWLVELDEPIRPLLRTYERHDDGSMTIDRVAAPVVRHVVAAREEIRNEQYETLVYPAFASGDPRSLDGSIEQIAGGLACTHVDALADLAAGYAGLECDVDGDRCAFAMGRNQVILYE